MIPGITDKVDLVLTDVEGERQADETLAALSDLAYGTATTAIEEPRHRSRFFFRASTSVSTEVAARVKKFKPKKLEHIDEAVDKRLRQYRKEMPKEISANLEIVREFFLTQIGPKTLAGTAGTAQAKEVVQRLLNTEVNSATFSRYERMVATGTDMLMARFIASYLGLPKSAAQDLVASLQPPRVPITVPVPDSRSKGQAGRQARNREAGASDRETNGGHSNGN